MIAQHQATHHHHDDDTGAYASNSTTDVVDAVTRHLLPPPRSTERHHATERRVERGDCRDVDAQSAADQAPHMDVSRSSVLAPPTRSLSRQSARAPLVNEEGHSEQNTSLTLDVNSHWERQYRLMRDKCEVISRRLVESISASQQREIELGKHLRDEQQAHNTEVLTTLEKVESVLLECIPEDFAALVMQPAAYAAGAAPPSPSDVLSRVYRLVTISQAVAAQKKLDAATAEATTTTMREALLPVRQQVSDATRVLFHLSLHHDASQARRPLNGTTSNHASTSRASPQPLFPPPSPTARRPAGGVAVSTQRQAVGASARRSGSTDGAAIRYVPLDGTPEVQRLSMVPHHRALKGSGSSQSRRERSASARVDVKSGSLLRELDGTPHDDGPFAKLRERLCLRHDQIPKLPGKNLHAAKSASPNLEVDSARRRPTASASQAPSGSFEVHHVDGASGHPQTRPSSITGSEGIDHPHVSSCDPSPHKLPPSQSARTTMMSTTTAEVGIEIQAACDLLREAFHELERLTVLPEKLVGKTVPHWVNELQADVRRLTATSLLQLQRCSTTMPVQPISVHDDLARRTHPMNPATRTSGLPTILRTSEHNINDRCHHDEESVATNLFSSHHGGDRHHCHHHTMPSKNVSLESHRTQLDIEEFSDHEDEEEVMQHSAQPSSKCVDDAVVRYPRPEPLRSTTRSVMIAPAGSGGKRVIGFIPAPHVEDVMIRHDEDVDGQQWDQQHHQPTQQAQQSKPHRRMVVSPMFDD
jgi:hypothetical protein